MTGLDWHEQAACNGVRFPDMFAPRSSTNGQIPVAAYEVANEFCRPCPVKAQCDEQRRAEGEGAAGLIWAGQLVTQKSQHRGQLRVLDLLTGGVR